MRVLHTSDWHLGRSFKNVGMLGVQQRALEHLVDTVRAESVEAVLVAGDVYDRAVPGPEAVLLLSQTLEALVGAGAQVVLSSGNHDSAVRLGFASGLLRRSGVHVVTDVAQIGSAVRVGPLAIYPIPYLEPVVCAGPLGAAERTHAGVMRAALARVRAAHEGDDAVIAMAHGVATGGEGCESERDIGVGGISAVPPSVFAGLTYVAMGHLHGAQRITDTIHYSGSPYPMSFGEARHVKSWTLVDFARDGTLTDVRRVRVPEERRLARLRGPIEALLTDPRHAADEDAWCSVVLTDPIRPRAAMERLRTRFPHAIELTFDPVGAPVAMASYAARVAGRDPLQICCDFVAHVRGGAPADEAERATLRAALDEARRARAVRDDEGLATSADPEAVA